MYGNTAQAQDLVDRMQSYGVVCDGEVVGSEYHESVDYANQMTLAEFASKGGRITRVRVLASRDWGYPAGDVSYIHGEIEVACPTCEGRRSYYGGAGCSTCRSTGSFTKTVPLSLGGDVFSGRMYGPRGLKARMIDWAKEEKVFAKGLGLLDESNWSVLWG